MIIVHGSTPLELLKTAMLCKIYNCNALSEKQISGSLYSGETLHSSSGSLDYITDCYEKIYGPICWLKTGKVKALVKAAHYALRYKAEDRFQLVITTFTQALDKGPDYVISRVSKEARLMYDRSRQVFAEFHRACGFIRLNPMAVNAGEIMVGKVEFQHNVADLVLNYFTLRTNNIPVYLVEHDHVYHYHQNKLTISNTNELPFQLPSDDFSEMWNAYYDSQYMKERKNPALARKLLPKKYWSWVPEGNKLI